MNTTGAALRNIEFLTFDPLEATLETTPETTRGPSPEALGPSLLGLGAQGQSPWVLGATGEGPQVVS